MHNIKACNLKEVKGYVLDLVEKAGREMWVNIPSLVNLRTITFSVPQMPTDQYNVFSDLERLKIANLPVI